MIGFSFPVARRKTIYEYHRVNFNGIDITNNTVIELTPNPTCNAITDCVTCTTKLVGSFNVSHKYNIVV